MRFGVQEILIIIVVILVVVGIAQIRRTGKDDAREEDASQGVRKYRDSGKLKKKRRPYLRTIGIVLVTSGIIILLVNLSLFKWVFWANILSSATIAIGLVAVFMARRI